MAATKAALEEGIVPGGAIALLSISQKMKPEALKNTKLNKDEKEGFNIVKKAIEQPFKRLVENAGLDAGQLIAKAREVSIKGMGFDVLKTESVDSAKPIDMVQAGIIDPLKVVRTAVQNAVSVASMILTTEALVTDIPEKKPEAPAMPGGMDMGY